MKCCSGRSPVSFAGEGVIKVVTRLMGPVLAVIGTQMVLQGAENAVKAYSP